jgi:hypothetical protein
MAQALLSTTCTALARSAALLLLSPFRHRRLPQHRCPLLSQRRLESPRPAPPVRYRPPARAAAPRAVLTGRVPRSRPIERHCATCSARLRLAPSIVATHPLTSRAVTAAHRRHRSPPSSCSSPGSPPRLAAPSQLS